ncbi:MFS transporter [Sphingobacteriales bacterium UPWRP_1]|nr:MFS transporter [Sphingobacteriales bacterium TSM_CSM]PSJ78147.1 MFS transporter [Sphingobacteriales bacterium UPWRP_1]
MNSKTTHTTNPLNIIVIVSALGYFVDIYDLILFGIVRNPSLTELGFSGTELTDKGLMLFNWQMAGMLLGGIIWGVLGDVRGRVSVLFGSIFLYSAANIANGFVHDITTYSVLRFLAGIGLAGELGAGITLVSETMTKETRGYGTMVVVTFGALGAVAAALIGDFFTWRIAYFVGGGLGFALFALRMSTYESAMFQQVMQNTAIRRGDFFQLFTNKKRAFRYLNCILVGLPIWFSIGLLIVLSPEFSKAIGVVVKDGGTVKASTAIMFAYIGLSVGDFFSGFLSQLLKTRRKVVIGFLITLLFTIAVYLFSRQISYGFYLFLCFLIGAVSGYWAIFATIASEQFGTNLRATVTTTVPNFVRGAVVPITLSFQWLKPQVGIIYSAFIVGLVCLTLAFAAILNLHETYGKDLNYVEE